MESEEVLVRLAAVVVLGVGSQWLAWRVRLPSILLLLIVGFVAGELTGFIDPNELLGGLFIPFVGAGVAIVLFEGGLTLRVAELPTAAGVVRNLIVLGATITWAIGALFAALLLDLPTSQAILLGAILIVTGPTVIVPLLEHIRPIGQVNAVLKWEGIGIDPVGALLAVIVFEIVLIGDAQEATLSAVAAVVRALAAGLVMGVLGAAFIVAVLRRFLAPDYLQNPIALMAVIGIYAGANLFQEESGLLAATVMGAVLANQRAVAVRHIVEFKENLRVLLIGSLFILLASQIHPDDLADLGAREAVFLAVLILVARPLVVALATLRSTFTWRERAFIAWMAPRGIVAASVASVFALRLIEQGQEGAERLVPITFSVIVGTIVVYGLSGPYVGRALGLTSPEPQGLLVVGAHSWACDIAKAVQAAGFRVLLVDSNRPNVHAAQLRGLEARHASILSDRIKDELDLEGIGRLLAMTANDEVNSLAAQQFAETFGRSSVYQLATSEELSQTKATGDEEAIPQHLRGRLLFSSEGTFRKIEAQMERGSTVKSTKLSDEFDYASYKERYGDKALPLLVVDGNRLRVISIDAPPAPKPGQTLISIVAPIEEPDGSVGSPTTGTRAG